jgi:hypothetical protein
MILVIARSEYQDRKKNASKKRLWQRFIGGQKGTKA